MPEKNNHPRGLTPEDRELWRSFARGIKPVPGRKKPQNPPSLPAAEPRAKKEQARSSASKTPAPPPKPGTGLDRRTHQTLKRGKRAIEARLDLHGFSRETAHDALLAFIDKMYAADKRTLLVITGKGSGILRTSVSKWLNEHATVLAAEPAQPKDGGAGAFYVLLRRKRYKVKTH